MGFQAQRRQQFLTEALFKQDDSSFARVLAALEDNLKKPEPEPGVHLDSARGLGFERFNRLCLHYTAGLPIEQLRIELGEVVAAYERYARHLRKYQENANFSAFALKSLDDYSKLIQLIGLCYLLHRRDLLARLASIVDGPDKINVGVDWLIEEFLAYAPMDRYSTDILLLPQPYEALADALSSEDNAAALKEIQRFLKRWYRDHAGTGWHDSHKEPGGGGYCGYWSFETGAAVLLLNIEDDSSLHQYLYYPKDMVAFARTSKSVEGSLPDNGRCPAGQPCPRDGWWFTPAMAGSRRYFKHGQIMPALDSSYGDTIWQWDADQGEPES